MTQTGSPSSPLHSPQPQIRYIDAKETDSYAQLIDLREQATTLLDAPGGVTLRFLIGIVTLVAGLDASAIDVCEFDLRRLLSPKQSEF